eukprot:g5579.t1
MSLPAKFQVEIRELKGNRVCCDCKSRMPQWASVSHGTLSCLECSGQHRSLGVHISFVRSVQMDSWNDRQIKALQMGGNDRLNSFLKKHGVPVDELSIKDKYDNPTAEAYRERLSARISKKPEPTGPVPKYQRKALSCKTERNGSHNGTEKSFAEASPDQRKRMEEEARERMRKKFGASSGLGSGGTFSNQAVGSHGIHHEPAARHQGGFGDDWFSSMGSTLSKISTVAASKAQNAVQAVSATDWDSHRQNISSTFGDAVASVKQSVNSSGGSSSSSWGNWASGLADFAAEKARKASQTVRSVATDTGAIGGVSSAPVLYRRDPNENSFPKLYRVEKSEKPKKKVGKVMLGFGGGGNNDRTSEKKDGSVPANGDGWGDNGGWGSDGGWGDDDDGALTADTTEKTKGENLGTADDFNFESEPNISGAPIKKSSSSSKKNDEDNFTWTNKVKRNDGFSSSRKQNEEDYDKPNVNGVKKKSISDDDDFFSNCKGGQAPAERLPPTAGFVGTFRHAPPVRGVESLQMRTGEPVTLRGVLDLLSFNLDDIAMSIAQARSFNPGALQPQLLQSGEAEEESISSVIATPNNAGGGMMGFNTGGMMGVITRLAAASAMHRKRLHVTPEELERIPVFTFSDLLCGNTTNVLENNSNNKGTDIRCCKKWGNDMVEGKDDFPVLVVDDDEGFKHEAEWENVVTMKPKVKAGSEFTDEDKPLSPSPLGGESYVIEEESFWWGNNSDATNGQTSCVICQEQFEKMDTLRQLPCKHIFHRKCVDRWLLGKHSCLNTRTTNCPICKEDVRITSEQRKKRKLARKKAEARAKLNDERSRNMYKKGSDDCGDYLSGNSTCNTPLSSNRSCPCSPYPPSPSLSPNTTGTLSSTPSLSSSPSIDEMNNMKNEHDSNSSPTTSSEEIDGNENIVVDQEEKADANRILSKLKKNSSERRIHQLMKEADKAIKLTPPGSPLKSTLSDSFAVIGKKDYMANDDEMAGGRKEQEKKNIRNKIKPARSVIVEEKKQTESTKVKSNMPLSMPARVPVSLSKLEGDFSFVSSYDGGSDGEGDSENGLDFDFCKLEDRVFQNDIIKQLAKEKTEREVSYRRLNKRDRRKKRKNKRKRERAIRDREGKSSGHNRSKNCRSCCESPLHFLEMFVKKSKSSRLSSKRARNPLDSITSTTKNKRKKRQSSNSANGKKRRRSSGQRRKSTRSKEFAEMSFSNGDISTNDNTPQFVAAENVDKDITLSPEKSPARNLNRSFEQSIADMSPLSHRSRSDSTGSMSSEPVLEVSDDSEEEMNNNVRGRRSSLRSAKKQSALKKASIADKENCEDDLGGDKTLTAGQLQDFFDDISSDENNVTEDHNSGKKSRRKTCSPGMAIQAFQDLSSDSDSGDELVETDDNVIKASRGNANGRKVKAVANYCYSPVEAKKAYPKHRTQTPQRSILSRKSKPVEGGLLGLTKGMGATERKRVNFGSPKAATFRKSEPVNHGMTPMPASQSKVLFSMEGAVDSIDLSDEEESCDEETKINASMLSAWSDSDTENEKEVEEEVSLKRRRRSSVAFRRRSELPSQDDDPVPVVPPGNRWKPVKVPTPKPAPIRSTPIEKRKTPPPGLEKRKSGNLSDSKGVEEKRQLNVGPPPGNFFSAKTKGRSQPMIKERARSTPLHQRPPPGLKLTGKRKHQELGSSKSKKDKKLRRSVQDTKDVTPRKKKNGTDSMKLRRSPRFRKNREDQNADTTNMQVRRSPRFLQMPSNEKGIDSPGETSEEEPGLPDIDGTLSSTLNSTIDFEGATVELGNLRDLIEDANESDNADEKTGEIGSVNDEKTVELGGLQDLLATEEEEEEEKEMCHTVDGSTIEEYANDEEKTVELGGLRDLLAEEAEKEMDNTVDESIMQANHTVDESLIQRNTNEEEKTVELGGLRDLLAQEDDNDKEIEFTNDATKTFDENTSGADEEEKTVELGGLRDLLAQEDDNDKEIEFTNDATKTFDENTSGADEEEKTVELGGLRDLLAQEDDNDKEIEFTNDATKTFDENTSGADEEEKTVELGGLRDLLAQEDDNDKEIEFTNDATKSIDVIDGMDGDSKTIGNDCIEPLGDLRDPLNDDKDEIIDENELSEVEAKGISFGSTSSDGENIIEPNDRVPAMEKNSTSKTMTPSRLESGRTDTDLKAENMEDSLSTKKKEIEIQIEPKISTKEESVAAKSMREKIARLANASKKAMEKTSRTFKDAKVENVAIEFARKSARARQISRSKRRANEVLRKDCNQSSEVSTQVLKQGECKDDDRESEIVEKSVTPLNDVQYSNEEKEKNGADSLEDGNENDNDLSALSVTSCNASNTSFEQRRTSFGELAATRLAEKVQEGRLRELRRQSLTMQESIIEVNEEEELESEVGDKLEDAKLEMTISTPKASGTLSKETFGEENNSKSTSVEKAKNGWYERNGSMCYEHPDGSSHCLSKNGNTLMRIGMCPHTNDDFLNLLLDHAVADASRSMEILGERFERCAWILRWLQSEQHRSSFGYKGNRKRTIYTSNNNPAVLFAFTDRPLAKRIAISLDVESFVIHGTIKTSIEHILGISEKDLDFIFLKLGEMNSVEEIKKESLLQLTCEFAEAIFDERNRRELFRDLCHNLGFQSEITK